MARTVYRRQTFFVRIMGRAAVVFILIPLVAGMVAACGDRSGAPVTDEERTERTDILTMLDSANRDDFVSSFERLSDYDFNRYIRTEQYDDEDYMVAFDEYLVRTTGSGDHRLSHVERTDSAGAFDFGFFNRFVSENVDSADPINMIPYILPEDAGYDDPRNLDKYRFRLLADTLLGDREARVVEITAKPGEGDGMHVRLVRQFIDRDTNKIVGAYLERIDLALLFREESSFYVDLKPGPDGRLVPHNTQFQTRIGTPFRGTYKIRTVSTYSEFTPAANP